MNDCVSLPVARADVAGKVARINKVQDITRSSMHISYHCCLYFENLPQLHILGGKVQAPSFILALDRTSLRGGVTMP